MSKPGSIRNSFLSAGLVLLLGTPGQACDLAIPLRDPERLAQVRIETFRYSQAIARVRTERTHLVNISGVKSVSEVVVVEGWKGLRAGDKLKIYNSQEADGDCTSWAPPHGKTDLLSIGIDQRQPFASYPFVDEAFLKEYHDRWFELERTALRDLHDAAKWMALAAYLDDWNDLRNAARAYRQVLKIDPRNQLAKSRLVDLDRRRLSRGQRVGN